MNYPYINVNIQKQQRQNLSMLGINLTDDYSDGQMQSCRGISSERYPYITTSQKKQQVEYPYEPVAVYGWEKLFVVTKNSNAAKLTCYYDGRRVCDTTNTQLPKQFAVINSQLVMFPDKLSFNILDAPNVTATNLNGVRLISGFTSGNIRLRKSTGSGVGGALNLPGDISAEVGDQVRLVGCHNPQNDGMYTIQSVFYDIDTDETVLGMEEDFHINENFTASSDNPFQIYDDGNYVPDLDYICSSNNRLWGCNSRLRTVYASALGDPSDFWTFDTDSLSAYQVAVGSDGEFTGCLALSNSVLFFKQHCIHKMLGSYPAEYALYTYDNEGISETNGLSAVTYSNTAIFVSEHGISTYSGSTSGTLSKELGEIGINNAIGFCNGKEYILSFTDDSDNGHVYSFDLEHGLWIEKGDKTVKAYAHLIDEDYFLVSENGTNKLYKLNCGVDSGIDWEIEFKPYIERYSSSRYSTSEIFETKRYTGITIRLELPKGSWIKAEIKADDLPYRQVSRLAGRENKAVDMVIRTPRCDKLQLKLSGHGPMTILSMERQYITGSRR